MILSVSNLSASLRTAETPVLKGVSFQVREHECLGILGESGSGKTLTWKALTGMLDQRFAVSGTCQFMGRDLLTLDAEESRQIRGRHIGIIMQNPMTAFDPLFTIGYQIWETLRAHGTRDHREWKTMALDMLEQMSLADPAGVLKKYPHELSGGMLQRVMTGLSLIHRPQLIIADEPTTATDTVNTSRILDMFEQIRARTGLSLLFISHDISVLMRIADRILVFSGGKIVEEGPTDRILHKPEHRETRFLVHSRQKLLDRYAEVTGEMQ